MLWVHVVHTKVVSCAMQFMCAVDMLHLVHVRKIDWARLEPYVIHAKVTTDMFKMPSRAVGHPWNMFINELRFTDT